MRLKIAFIFALIVFCLAFVLLGTSGLALLADDAQDSSETPDPEANGSTEDGGEDSDEAGLVEAVASRTPVPTATPGVVEEVVSQLTDAAGLTHESFLGLTVEDWINLALSLLFTVATYWIGGWLIHDLLRRLTLRTRTKFDDEFLVTVGPQVRWLVVVLVLQSSTKRLSFLSVDFKATMSDIYFSLLVLVVSSIAWKLVDFAAAWYQDRLLAAPETHRFNPVIIIVRRISQALLIVIAATVLLSHYGISIAAFAASLGIAGLAFSLAAQDTLADAISGFIILVDQPFRIGDRIEVADLGTWGDVVSIGVRTTRIRTRDNRMVIVPNSVIGKNQVVNYTFPDPRYRVQVDIGLAYGTDIEKARRVITETVREVPGVLMDKPVDALYHEMGDSSMIFRIRWWIESYEDLRRLYDRVNTALQHALDEAGIESPYPTQSLNIKIVSDDAQPTSPGPSGPDS